MSSWIKMINDEDADEELKIALNEAKTPHGTVDNVLRVHSLRPSTMIGHMKLYKSVLHDKKNTIPMWFQETISSYVSMINNCNYSFENHWKNAVFLINDKEKSEKIRFALENNKPENFFESNPAISITLGCTKPQPMISNQFLDFLSIISTSADGSVKGK